MLTSEHLHLSGWLKEIKKSHLHFLHLDSPAARLFFSYTDNFSQRITVSFPSILIHIVTLAGYLEGEHVAFI